MHAGGEGRDQALAERVEIRPFLDLVGEKQASVHELPPDRIRYLNRLIVGDIEIAMRRGVGYMSNT